MNYLILAGGTGTRLKDLTLNLPKPLIEIENKPAILRIINQISLFDQDAKIYVSSYFKSSEIKKFFISNPSVEVIEEPEKLGTGGAIKFFLNKQNVKDFCLLNGDTLINFDFSYLNLEWEKVKNKYNVNALVFLKKIYGDCSDYGTYSVEGTKVTKFKEKLKVRDALVSTGIYFFEAKSLKKELKKMPKKFSFEEKFLPLFIKNKSLCYRNLSKFDLFFDIGTPKKLRKVKENFLELSKRPAAFFDRDNSLVHDDGYNADLKNYLVLQDAYLIMSLLKSLGFLIFIVSNQSSINRKINSKKKVIKFNEFLIKDFKKREALITKSIFCNHTPDEKCKCRKPNTKMIEDLTKQYNLDITKSVFLGDSMTDEKLSLKCKMDFIKLGTEEDLNNVLRFVKNLNFK